jgi:hypothetical protein
VEFRNGRTSELHEVIPIQKALNKSFIDLIASADAAGFRILFASGWTPTSDGQSVEVDSTGRVTSGNKPLTIEPGAILYTENPNGTLQSVPGDDLTRIINVLDRHILSIAQVSRTPISNFQLFGQIPSADSQKQLETGLLAKVKSRCKVYGNAWEDLIYLAQKMAIGAPVYENGRIVGYGLEAYSLQGTEEVKLGTLWEPAETRNEKEHLETLTLKKALGVPSMQLFLEMGYSQEKAEEFEAQAEERRLTMFSMVGGNGQDQGQGQGINQNGSGSGQPDNANGSQAGAGQVAA